MQSIHMWLRMLHPLCVHSNTNFYDQWCFRFALPFSFPPTHSSYPTGAVFAWVHHSPNKQKVINTHVFRTQKKKTALLPSSLADILCKPPQSVISWWETGNIICIIQFLARVNQQLIPKRPHTISSYLYISHGDGRYWHHTESLQIFWLSVGSCWWSEKEHIHDRVVSIWFCHCKLLFVVSRCGYVGVLFCFGPQLGEVVSRWCKDRCVFINCGSWDLGRDYGISHSVVFILLNAERDAQFHIWSRYPE